MHAFDAGETGGYRDLLLNLRCKETGHIVEVQVSLASLLLVKAAGGHASYQLARMHGFFEETSYKYEGKLSEQARPAPMPRRRVVAPAAPLPAACETGCDRG